MRHYLIVAAALVFFGLNGCTTKPRSASSSQEPKNVDDRQLPGPRADGSILLPTQWSLRPAGRQVVLGDFPVNIALHPEGQFAAVLHCGYGTHEIIVVDVKGGRVVSRTSLDESFYGVSFSSDGTQIFCSGSSGEVIFGFKFAKGYLSEPQSIALRDVRIKGIPAGITVDSTGKTLYVANLWSHQLSRVDLSATPPTITELMLGTNAPTIVSPAQKPVEEDQAAITKRAEALLQRADSHDPFPYGVVLDEVQRKLYVSLWGLAGVAVIDLASWKEVARWRVEEHPNEMLLSRSAEHLFVANANRNTVSVIETATGRVIETLRAELYPDSPPGSTPNSLAFSPDEKLLFVANANINTVSVFDISDLGKSRSLGFIPVGWYPTSVRVTPDGKQLLVANGKGIISKANRLGPQPGKDPPATVREYIGGLFRGTLSIIALPQGERWEAQLKTWTRQAYACSPPHADWQNQPSVPKDSPIPKALGQASPIQYCVYIIKENRTYDQILGDLPVGNGDAGLCLFPERITPNHHALAMEFGVLDNFYVESEVSADGHEWTMGAYATDFVEKSWPLSYGHNQRRKHVYPAEGRFEIAKPAGGYLWDRAREAGVSYRSYGEFVDNGKTPDDPSTSRVPALVGHFDPGYRGFDMDYPDMKRADRFISELKRFEREGEMPRLQIVRLPNDHTSGTATNKLTPTVRG